jgi:hypothetical protein
MAAHLQSCFRREIRRSYLQWTSCKSKLVHSFEFHVADSSNQVEAQSKTFVSISKAFTQNARDFQSANNVLNQNKLSRQRPIASLLFLVQHMQFAFPGRCFAVWVKFCKSLITGIRAGCPCNSLSQVFLVCIDWRSTVLIECDASFCRCKSCIVFFPWHRPPGQVRTLNGLFGSVRHHNFDCRALNAS